MEKPSMKTPFLLGLGTIVALWLGWSQMGWAEWVRALLVIVGLWLGAWLGVAVVEYAKYASQVAAWRSRKIALMTEKIAEMDKQLEVVRAVRMLTPKQIDMISTYGPIAATLAGDIGPLPGMETQDGQVPYWYIDDFMARSSGRFLTPVGNWSEGTSEREFAQWLTRWLIDRGMAEPSGGPYAARWREGGRALAVQAIYGERINNRRESYANGNAVV
jgi:hypothetical protein